MLLLIKKDSRRTVVCSADPAVTLKRAPAGEDGAPPMREKRRPIRWLDVDGEVESVGAGALRVTYRALDSDETAEITGGLSVLTKERLGPSYQRATALAVVSVVGEGVDAQRPDEVRKVIGALKQIHREPLGERILDESMGFIDPLPSSE